MTLELGIFEPDLAFSIEEANTEVDGRHILAKAKGTFCVLDGISRNKRFYPRSLWENVIKDSDVQKRMSERRMYGTIGHTIPINDDTLRDGKLSHIVTALNIVGNNGIGEVLILDTPAGRILNTLLRGGSKLFVSSRANGTYKGEHQGMPIVDPDTFLLETFDFVLEPGFLVANPSLVEDYKKITGEAIVKESLNTEENPMSEKLLEQLATQNASYKVDLERAVRENEALKNTTTILTEENSHVKNEANKLKAQVRALEAYKAFGTPDELNTMFKMAEKKITEYKSFFKSNGNPKLVEKALTEAQKKITEYKGFFKEFGEPKEIKEALSKSFKAVTSYKEFGSLPELRECFASMEKEATKIKEAKSATKIAALAKELNVTEEVIKEAYGKISEASIRKMFTKVTESNKVANTYRKNEPTSESNTLPTKSFSAGSRGERLMESLCR